jgi:membrane-bound lytic murein transglycosylase B
MIRTLLLTVVLAFTATVLAAPATRAATKAGVEAQFRQWLEADLWPEAKRNGVSKAVFDRAFSGVELDWDLPDLAPPGFPKPKARAQSQAEFRSPGAYFSEKRLQGLAASGRSLMKKHAGLLRRIEERYGVPGAIIVAVWGRESGFGRAKIPHNAVRVIATKAFMSTRPGAVPQGDPGGAEDPSTRRCSGVCAEGILGRCHGPAAVPAVELSRPCGRF